MTCLISDNQEWKPVFGYENLYEISNSGCIRRLPSIVNGKSRSGKNYLVARIGRILRQNKAREGYPFVTLSKHGVHKKFYVHRGVAEAFLEKPTEWHQVNHKNGKRDDNRACNLEWVTPSENIIHAVRVLKRKLASTRPIKAVNITDGGVLKFDMIKDVEKFGFSEVTVRKKLRNRQPYRGYLWFYTTKKRVTRKTSPYKNSSDWK